MSSIEKTIHIKPYKNGCVIDNEKVKQGVIMPLLQEILPEYIRNMCGNADFPIGDKRLESEFSVTISINFKE